MIPGENAPQLLGQLKLLLSAAAGYAVGSGVLTEQTATAIVGVGGYVIPMVAEYLQQRWAQRKIDEAADAPRATIRPELREDGGQG